jgi:hypothetical protein
VEWGVLRTCCSVGTEFNEVLDAVVNLTSHDDKERVQHDETSELEPYKTDNVGGHEGTVIPW